MAQSTRAAAMWTSHDAMRLKPNEFSISNRLQGQASTVRRMCQIESFKQHLRTLTLRISWRVGEKFCALLAARLFWFEKIFMLNKVKQVWVDKILECVCTQLFHDMVVAEQEILW